MTAAATDVRKCLIAMDGSEHADYALEWFLENVHRPKDYVILVYVPELSEALHSHRWGTPVYQFNMEMVEKMLKDEQDRIKADLDIFADKLRHHRLGGKVKSVVASKPGEGIIEAAEHEGVQLIVTGSRGQGKIRRTFMGSVSDYVVHHSHIPVFVCKHPSGIIPGHENHHKSKAEQKADKASHQDVKAGKEHEDEGVKADEGQETKDVTDATAQIEL